MLVKWNPVGSLLNTDSLFDSFFKSELPIVTTGFDPSIDIEETEKNFTIKAELPGLSKDDFKITVENNTLILEGEKKVEDQERSDTFYRSERRYGSFRRAFRLTDSVDSSKISAEHKDGILSITIPKSAKAKPKMIEVKTS